MAWDQPPRVPAGPWTTGSGGILGSQNSIAHPGPPPAKQPRLGVEAVEGGELSLVGVWVGTLRRGTEALTLPSQGEGGCLSHIRGWRVHPDTPGKPGAPR